MNLFKRPCAALVFTGVIIILFATAGVRAEEEERDAPGVQVLPTGSEQLIVQFTHSTIDSNSRNSYDGNVEFRLYRDDERVPVGSSAGWGFWQFVDSSLTPSTWYEYKVCAVYDDEPEEERCSVPVRQKTLMSELSPEGPIPANITHADSTDRSATVFWNRAAFEGRGQYGSQSEKNDWLRVRIYGVDTGHFEWKNIANPDYGSLWAFQNLEPLKKYRIELQGYSHNSFGMVVASSVKSEIFVETKPTLLPSQPPLKPNLTVKKTGPKTLQLDFEALMVRKAIGMGEHDFEGVPRQVTFSIYRSTTKNHNGASFVSTPTKIADVPSVEGKQGLGTALIGLLLSGQYTDEPDECAQHSYHVCYRVVYEDQWVRTCSDAAPAPELDRPKGAKCSLVSSVPGLKEAIEAQRPAPAVEKNPGLRKVFKPSPPLQDKTRTSPRKVETKKPSRSPVKQSATGTRPAPPVRAPAMPLGTVIDMFRDTVRDLDRIDRRPRRPRDQPAPPPVASKPPVASVPPATPKSPAPGHLDIDYGGMATRPGAPVR